MFETPLPHRMECNSLQSMWHQCLGEFYISNTTRQYKTQKTRSMLTFVAMNSYSCILGGFIQEVSAVKNKITKWLIRANDHNDIYFGWLDLRKVSCEWPQQTPMAWTCFASIIYTHVCCYITHRAGSLPLPAQHTNNNPNHRTQCNYLSQRDSLNKKNTFS